MNTDRTLLGLARFRPRSPLASLGLGVACAAAGLVIRAAAAAFYGEMTGFMILLPGVILAALAAGRLAGLVAIAASLGGGWLLVSLGSGDTIPGLGRVATFNFVVVGLFCVVVADSLRRTLGRLDDSLAALMASDARADDTEARLRMISEHAPVMLWMSDEQGKCVHLNADQRAFWAAPADLSGFDFPATIHPDERDAVLAATRDAIAARAPMRIEARSLRNDGQWRILRTEARPRVDARGQFLGMLGVNTDVTEARRAEAALRESESRFRLMADTAPSPVWLTNAEGEVEFVNQALSDFYGRPPEAILGDMWKATIHPEDRAAVVAAQAQARPHHLPYDFEARFLNGQGQWRWMRVAVNPRTDATNAFLGYVGLSFDITDAREALVAVARQERRQTFLLQLSDRLRDLGDTEAIMAEVERSLGDLLDAHRVGYGEVDHEAGEVSMSQDWTSGVPSARGRFPLYAFGADLIADLEAGRVISIRDVRLDPRTADAASAFDAIQTRALIRAPLIRGGRLDAYLYVHVSEPREWTDAEVELVEEVAARTWAEVQRARAESAVRESEERFRAIADTAPVLIWVTQQDRSRAFVNQAYVAYSGRSYEEARLTDWRDILHPDDQARILRESLAGEATGEPFSMEARYRRHDGVYRWLKSFSRPRLGPKNEVLGFVGVAFDVTDIRETNARLEAAAAERDAILGQLGEGVVVTDPEGRIVFVNEAAGRLHGVRRLGVEPDDYADAYRLFTEDGHPHPPETLPLARAVRDGETVQDARWRIRRPDGSEVLAVGNARPVAGPDGERIGAVLTLRDETARVQAEHRLAESEARFRTVADSAPALIWMTDETARIIFANRRYRSFFGLRGASALGEGWRRRLHPDDRSLFENAFGETFARRDRFELRMRVNHPTLGLRWLRCEGVPRFDASGAFQGYVGANLDVTETKKAEDDLKRINELLEERVGEVLAEKAKAEADLLHAQRLEAVGRLTGGVAHDFNNLLTVVIGALDIVLRSDDPAKRQRLGEAALAAARRGERLTHQLLAFSRRQTLRPTPIDLNALIREGEPLLRRALGEAVEFQLKLKRGGAHVNVDPAQFEAALLNLVVNARDAVGDKGQVGVQTLTRRVKAGEVPDLAPGDYVCIAVTDDGEGMDPEVVGRVFEPFFTTKAVGKGTGLGLSQVYGFARQSGGAVTIDSAPGQGAELRLYLPQLPVKARAATEPPRAEMRPLTAGGRVLLVEDEPSVAAVAVDILTEFGLEVATAPTGPAALEVLSRERFDLMLTDVVMPGGMTGVELAQRCAHEHPAMGIVLTSGYVGEDVDTVLAEAPWPLLRKPYSAEGLRRILDNMPHPPV